MKATPAPQQDHAGTRVNPVAAHIMIDRLNEVHALISRRAYELFESRGRASGQDLEDWAQAESELLHPCSHELKESAEAVILHAEMPGNFAADQISFSIEPWRVI